MIQRPRHHHQQQQQWIKKFAAVLLLGLLSIRQVSLSLSFTTASYWSVSSSSSDEKNNIQHHQTKEEEEENASRSSAEEPRPHHHDTSGPSSTKNSNYHKKQSTTSPPTSSTTTKTRLSFEESTRPDPNLKTLGYFSRIFRLGFRNQAMAFAQFVIYAHNHDYKQILLPTLHWHDMFGSKRWTPHELLFDVVHWNTHYYPTQLPRLVVHDDAVFPQFNGTSKLWTIEDPLVNATKPFAYGRQREVMNAAFEYIKNLTDSNKNSTQKQDHPVVRAILQGALRPHPVLQRHIDRLVVAAANTGKDVAATTAAAAGGGGGGYMSLHARVEPDMQYHTQCVSKKVLELKDIFAAVQKFDFSASFSSPKNNSPTTDESDDDASSLSLSLPSRLFIAINRPVLENGDPNHRRRRQHNDPIRIGNLQTLDHAMHHGLWNGTVEVFEAGRTSLLLRAAAAAAAANESNVSSTTMSKNDISDSNSSIRPYAEYPSISGSIVDFYLSTQSDIFIGTEVSSFSMDVIASRFYQGKMQNYLYLPNQQLVWATPPHDSTTTATVTPPRFQC